MTLEEAIAHLNESLNDPKRDWCEECKQEHEQLRDWLNELKGLRVFYACKVKWDKEKEKKTETDTAFLKQVIQGKDQRMLYLLGQINAYEKILFSLPWLENKAESGDE